MESLNRRGGSMPLEHESEIEDLLGLGLRTSSLRLWPSVSQSGERVEYQCPALRLHLEQRSATFSLKAQIANILGFLGHMKSVAITQLCHCGTEAAIEPVNKWA